jgi:phage terminase large subunit-like protein
VIAFDPAGTSKESSDESGVIVASLIDDKVYVFKDASGRYRPDEVVTSITNLYNQYEADRLTIETNFGGDWVPSTFESEDPNIVIHKVHARKGKKLRAEPVAHAYRQGRVIHVGDLSTLEDELTTWNPYDPKMRSPNRLDAVVYAVTDLLNIAAKSETPIVWSVG